jgi:hypothetical protein
VVRGAGAAESTSIGGEIDLALRYAIAPGHTAVLGFGRLFAGRFIEETGSSDDPWFWYLSWRVKTKT